MNDKYSLVRLLIIVWAIFSFSLAGNSGAQTEEQVNSGAAPNEPVTARVQDLKKKVIELNRDLFILEEDLLFPANTQFVVFLSVDVGEFFALDAVEVKIDGDTVSSYLYTDRQVKALHKGGMQRLHVGNLKTGEHEITAFFTGSGPNGRDYKRGASKKFTKGTDIKTLELKITDSTNKHQPEFTVVEWE